MKASQKHRWLERSFTAALCVLFGVLVITPVLSKVLQYNNFHINDWDVGIYFNVAWNVFEGDGFYSDVLRRNHLGEHFSPITAMFAPFLYFGPSPLWLLVGQGLAVGVTYIVLYFVAVKILTDSAFPFARLIAVILPAAAVFYRPLSAALLFEFHPSTLATPFLAAAILALLYRRNIALWALVALLLLTKENAALGILGLAIYAGLMQNRFRLFVALCGTAALSAALVMGVVMPLFQSGDWKHYDRLSPFSLIANKANYLFLLLKGLAFLPLGGWRCLVAAMPLVALNLSVKYDAQFSMKYHYDDLASVFLLVAAVHGLVFVVKLFATRLSGWRLTAALLCSVLVAAMLVRPEMGSPLPNLRIHWQSKEARQLHQELTEYRRLPKEIGIAATGPLGPYLSTRQRFLSFNANRLHLLNNLKPGDYVLTTPIRGGQKMRRVGSLLDGKPGLAKIHASQVLAVYEVLNNLEFPKQ